MFPGRMLNSFSFTSGRTSARDRGYIGGFGSLYEELVSEQDKAMGRLPYMTWFFRTSTAEAGDENVSPRKLICSSRFDLKLAIPHGSGRWWDSLPWQKVQQESRED